MSGTVLHGRAGSPGVGVGRVLCVAAPDDVRVPVGAPPAPVSSALTPGSSSAERERLLAALDTAAADLERLAEQTAARAGGDVGAIFEAQALFARDPGVVDPALDRIAAGAAADSAILAATEEQAATLAAVDDPYFRERAADVRDVGRRVAALIRGETRPDLWHADGVAAVLVAVDLDPSVVATLRSELVAGIALGGGAPTGHAAIVARALGLPLVLGLGDAIATLPADATAIVDGAAGSVVVDPSPDQIEAAARSGDTTAPTVMRPIGASPPHGVVVAANVASALEAGMAARAGADGIGLVRTELLFVGRAEPPSVPEQRATYAAIRAAMGERPVVFRTLDIGGDKPAAWRGGAIAEPNPALGVRGVRLGLRHPELLDAQFRALVEAAAGGELRVMLPMIATVEEVTAARQRLEATVAAWVAEGGSAPDAVLLGVMIEIPAAALMADALAEVADFFSIGTNDLVQYTLAVDRTNPELADIASPLQPAVLRLIDGVVRAARTRSRTVAVCGEAAADPAVIPLLVGLGVDELSVSPGSVGAVLRRLETMDRAAWQAAARRALAAASLPDVLAIAATFSSDPARAGQGAPAATTLGSG